MAFCEDCGSPLSEGVAFCENCGAKVVIKSFFCCSSFINNANYLHLACIDTIFRTLTSVKSYLWAHAAYACMVGIPLRRWAQNSA